MNTNRKVFGNSSSALGAKLRGVFGGDFNYQATSFFRFIPEYVEKPKPSRIPHLSGHSVVIAIEGCHILNANSIVVFEKLVGNLEVEVPPLIVHLFKGLSNKNSSLCPTLRAFLSTRQSLLSLCEYILGCLKEPRIAYLHPIGGGKEGFETDIYAYTPAGWGQGLCGNVVTGEADIPLTNRASADSDGLDIPLDGAGQPELEPANLRDGQVFAIQPPASLFQSERVISILSLEARKARLIAIAVLNSSEETLVGFIKALQYILKHLRAYFLIFRKGFFKFRELLHLRIARDRAFVLPINHDTLFKSTVVELATKMQPGFGFLKSMRIRQKTIFEGLFHFSRTMASVTYLKKGGKPYRASPSVSPL